jgi:hypothetical protein
VTQVTNATGELKALETFGTPQASRHSGSHSVGVLHWESVQKIPPGWFLVPVEQFAQNGEAYLILRIFPNAEFICEDFFHRLSVSI